MINSTGATDAGGSCAPPMTSCGGVCVDLMHDSKNCGYCGNLCPSGPCSGGTCMSGADAGTDASTGDVCGLDPGTVPSALEPLVVGYHLSSPIFGMEVGGKSSLTASSITAGPIVPTCGGASALFNGSSSYLSGPATGSGAPLGLMSSSMTVSTWIQIDSAMLPPANAAIVSTQSGTSGFFLGMDSTGSKLTFQVYQPGGALQTVTSPGLPSNGWHRITGVYRGGSMMLYVDGSSAGTIPVTGNFSPSGSIVIGGKTTAGPYWKGPIGEVRVYAM
jgi:hypothetical protein